MQDWEKTKLESLEIGPLPLVREFIGRIDLPAILERHLQPNKRGRPRDLPEARVVELLLENILISRQPLYAIADWLAGHAPEVSGFAPAQRKRLNDDRIGRALDRLFFRADGHVLATEVVLAAVRRFGIRLRQIHNDSTTVTFHGRYHDERRGKRDREPPTITFGYNKDHRPDLKQLVFELSTSADGAVPVHFRVHDGNVSDVQTHPDAWRALRELLGSPDFLYVADSKLASSDSMRLIDQSGGRFLSVLPRTRAETVAFRERLVDAALDWREVYRQPDPRHPKGPAIVYHAIEADATAEGFRLLWYRSSQKLELDQENRSKRLAGARERLKLLESKLGRGKLKEHSAAVAAARKILEEFDVEDFLDVRVELRVAEEFAQESRGRPGPNTLYRSIEVPYMLIKVVENAEAIANAARCDGIFPLVTNDRQLTLETALRAYKEQPFLERRHEQFKHALDVMPVHLKAPPRVTALLLVYFLALLILALIEREVRRQMKKAKIASLPLYPEERLCKRPTAEVVLDAFRGIRRHRLLDEAGNELRVFHDPLTPAARTLLDLLAIDPAPYGQEN
jgi:transposase